jgi:hypothetical protein
MVTLRATSSDASTRTDWSRTSFTDEVNRARSRWARSRPIPFPVSNYRRWSKAVVDRYTRLRLPRAYVALTPSWMRAYLRHPDVRPALTLIADQGVDVALLSCLIGFCAEHQAYFDRQGERVRQLFREALTLKRRPRLARELKWCATQLRVLAEAGMIGSVNGWLKMRCRLPKDRLRTRSGEYVDFAEVIPRLQALAAFLDRKEIGLRNVVDARYLLSGRRGARPASAFEEGAFLVTELLRHAGFAYPVMHDHAKTLLGPAFAHYTSAKAIYMRLKRRAARVEELPGRERWTGGRRSH